jgi:ATP-dependent Clp protease ATP-binding subunit ClpC
LKNKKIIVLDIPAMVAGAKYRGDFEERIKKTLAEVKNSSNIILFIDEIHIIVGAGAAEGAIDAANILKPFLARGEIQVIGATTITEYRKYIEKDSALERRFGCIQINEPSVEETINILTGLRDKYEAHHNVQITNEAIKASAELSSRYIADRFLPDKAIDLIDEAASKAKFRSLKKPEALAKLEEKIVNLEAEKEEAINLQDFEKAATIRDSILDAKERLENESKLWNLDNKCKLIKVLKEDVAQVLSDATHIPINQITEDENQKLKNLEKKIHERIIGQDEAVSSVARAIRRGRTGLKDENKPIGSFLFLGPTGVGKTELSKAIAEILFDNEDALIRIDMSEFMEPNTVSKLIGSPPRICWI